MCNNKKINWFLLRPKIKTIIRILLLIIVAIILCYFLI